MAQTVGVTPSGLAPSAPGTVNTPAGEAGTGDKPTVLPTSKQKELLGGQASKEGLDTVGGEFPTGTTGWIDLDETGMPTGTVTTVKDPGKSQAAVVNIQAITPDVLSTPAGAPLTTNMNPNPDHFDAGLAARNPPPPDTKTSKQALADEAQKKAEQAKAQAAAEKK